MFFAAPVAATSVDIILEGDSGSSDTGSDIGVTLYNLDTQRAYTGRTGSDGLAHIPDVTPGRYRIAIDGRGRAHLEYRWIKGPVFAHVYKIDDMITLPVGASLVSSLGTLLNQADVTAEEGDKKWYDLTLLRITALRDLHVSALAQLEEIDPKKGKTALRNEHRKVIDQCDKALNTPAGVVWPSRDLLIGSWTISPIPIMNTQDCGQVFQTGTMTVSEKAGPGHWRGTYSFLWDTSKADPACRFKFSKSGTATVDIYVNGPTVTVKYSNTGQNTFADDTLTLNGNVMSGQDATGQVVTYTRN